MENTIHNHNVVHHKLNAVKAIKSGWKHIMKSPWTYIGFTLLFMVMSVATNMFGYLGELLAGVLSMIAIKFLLDKYEGRKVEINFTFMEYLHYLGLQLLLGVSAVIMVFAISMPTLYPIYNVTVNDKEAFSADLRILMEDKNKNNLDKNISNESNFTIDSDTDNDNQVDFTQYFDIANHSTFVLSMLTLFLIGLCAIIYIFFRLSMAQYLLIDKKLDIIHAIKHSWHMTRNNVTQMSVLAIISSFIVIVGALALLVGTLFAIPLISMITLCAYKQMIGESK